MSVVDLSLIHIQMCIRDRFKTFQIVQGPVGTVVSVLMKLQSVSSETGLAVSALNAIMSANPADVYKRQIYDRTGYEDADTGGRRCLMD